MATKKKIQKGRPTIKKAQLSEDFLLVTKKMQQTIAEFQDNLETVLRGTMCLSAARRCRKLTKQMERLGKEWRKLSPKTY